MKAWKKARITVAKKLVVDDLVQEWADEEVKKKGFGVCDAFELGQQYILERPNQPEGFCSWAWADIHKDVIAIMGGASFHWIKKEGVSVACCSDGFRPVVFVIERV
jgi:uncharacterized repeat protein (TIGR04076 family)